MLLLLVQLRCLLVHNSRLHIQHPIISVDDADNLTIEQSLTQTNGTNWWKEQPEDRVPHIPTRLLLE